MPRSVRKKLESKIARYLAHEDGDESRHNTTPYPERAADLVEYFLLAAREERDPVPVSEVVAEITEVAALAGATIGVDEVLALREIVRLDRTKTREAAMPD